MARRRFKVSKAEKQILQLFKQYGYEVVPQFKIPGLPYAFDFYLPAFNLLIEYNGGYWHADPRLYKSGEMVRIAGTGLLYTDYIWARDNFKYTNARQLGFRLEVVWEKDFKKEGWRAVEKMLVKKN